MTLTCPIYIDSSHLIHSGCELMQHKSWSSLRDVVYHCFGSTALALWNYILESYRNKLLITSHVAIFKCMYVCRACGYSTLDIKNSKLRLCDMEDTSRRAYRFDQGTELTL